LTQTLQSYQLHIRLKETCRLTIGWLGAFDFPAGDYVYTGSAKRNIEVRIRRHLSQKKTLRWHIDYLLASPSAEITHIEQSGVPECALNQSGSGEVIAPRFGASDCGNGCGAHLKYRGAGQGAGAVSWVGC
jgi:Uri superfamily endonuclease